MDDNNNTNANNTNDNNEHNKSNDIENKIANFLEDFQKLIIWGIGNPLRNDDGLGPVFADNLANLINNPNNNPNNQLSEKIVIINAGSVPENFTGKIKQEVPSHIIIVDAFIQANNTNTNNNNNSNNNYSDNGTHINYITNNDFNNGYDASVLDTNNSNNIDNNKYSNNNSNNSNNNNLSNANDNINNNSNNNNRSNSEEYEHYGDIKLVSRDKIANISISSHSMPLSFLIKYLEIDISFELLIVGVVPKNMDFGTDISPEIQESLTYLEGIILNTLDL